MRKNDLKKKKSEEISCPVLHYVQFPQNSVQRFSMDNLLLLRVLVASLLQRGCECEHVETHALINCPILE